MIRVVGVKGRIKNRDDFIRKVEEYSKSLNVAIQVVDANLVYSFNHLYSAAQHAIRAMRRGTNSMKSLAMEILLYAAGERQIKNAIEKIGVKENSKSFVFIIVDDVADIKDARGKISDKDIDKMLEELHLFKNDSMLKGDKKILERFGISKNELDTVGEDRYEKLILEKVAMVDILK
ncbi:MAG: hypothetical protein DRJ99_00840 [Thermoplasmata archaeon]|nr:MAG: hypothetical protein DRJ99_00840 [Thermoplasmata archaeon]RLF62852.1 MAG: hypothetical protein DRN16_00335 [Thermoplasmata archaeon]